MGLAYQNLDEVTRRLMVAEVEQDIRNGSLYLGKTLTEAAKLSWGDLLTDAVRDKTDDWLAHSLAVNRSFNTHTTRRSANGTISQVRVPETAPVTLAEGEFNRFYVRALCRRALDEGRGQVFIYRARNSANPRPESEALVGHSFDAATLLERLRAAPDFELAPRVPLGPNSGLSVRL